MEIFSLGFFTHQLNPNIYLVWPSNIWHAKCCQGHRESDQGPGAQRMLSGAHRERSGPRGTENAIRGTENAIRGAQKAFMAIRGTLHIKLSGVHYTENYQGYITQKTIRGTQKVTVQTMQCNDPMLQVATSKLFQKVTACKDIVKL